MPAVLGMWLVRIHVVLLCTSKWNAAKPAPLCRRLIDEGICPKLSMAEVVSLHHPARQGGVMNTVWAGLQIWVLVNRLSSPCLVSLQVADASRQPPTDSCGPPGHRGWRHAGNIFEPLPPGKQL